MKGVKDMKQQYEVIESSIIDSMQSLDNIF